MSVGKVDTTLIEAGFAGTTYIIRVTAMTDVSYKRIDVEIQPGPSAGTYVNEGIDADFAKALGAFLVDVGGIDSPSNRLGRSLEAAASKVRAARDEA